MSDVQVVSDQKKGRLGRLLELGGIGAAVVLVVMGVASIGMSIIGMHTVSTSLQQQHIVGSSDMTPKDAAAEAKGEGLKPASLHIPSCSSAGVHVTNGSQARCFAQYMEVHALLATGGLYYSQLPQYQTSNGKGTNNEADAVFANNAPVEYPGRSTWVEQIAISTALNASYLASQLALFGIVVGVALMLAGGGFGVLAASGAVRSPGLGWPLRRRA